MDYRFSLYSAETGHNYNEVLNALRARSRSPREASPADTWEPVFKADKIAYVLVGEGDVTRRVEVTVHAVQVEQFRGMDAVLPLRRCGRLRLEQGHGPAPRRMNRFATTPGSSPSASRARRKPLHNSGRSRRPTPRGTKSSGSRNSPRSSEVDNALIHLLSNNRQEDLRNEEEALLAFIPARWWPPVSPGGSLVNGNGIANQLLYRTTRIMHDLGPPADLYLAVRARGVGAERQPRRQPGLVPAGAGLWDAGQTVPRRRGVLNSNQNLRELREAQMVAALTRSVRFNTEITPELEQASTSSSRSSSRAAYNDLVRPATRPARPVL